MSPRVSAKFGLDPRFPSMDPMLTGNELFSGTIEAALRGAGVIVSILSPAYLKRSGAGAS